MAIDDKMRDERLQYDINHNLDGLFWGSFCGVGVGEITPPPLPTSTPSTPLCKTC